MAKEWKIWTKNKDNGDEWVKSNKNEEIKLINDFSLILDENTPSVMVKNIFWNYQKELMIFSNIYFKFLPLHLEYFHLELKKNH